MTSEQIGVARPRLDAEPKLRGNTQFAADLPLGGALQARLVLSPFARARIRVVERDAALALPGVVAVLTADDIPTALAEGGASSRQNEPLARKEVVFAGQPVAIVVAETEAAAEDAVEAVVVDYEQLEAVLDLEAAAAPGAPAARLNVGGEDVGVAMHAEVGEGEAEEARDEEEVSANVVGRHVHAEGDVEAALAQCDAVVSGRFRTPWVYQAYLEPQAATAQVEADGSIFVLSSTQATFYAREQLGKIFDLPLSKIRVAGTPLGGAFGAKLLLIEPLAVGAALALNRSVRLSLTRSEDMAAAQPAPATLIDLELGARSDGGLVAIRARILIDAGAFADWSVEGIAGTMVAGPYRWSAWDLRSFGVLTNRFGTGAYRAPGAPQTAFALESLLDELAERLGLDPLDLRKRNAAREGDGKVDGGSWPLLGYVECLEAVTDHPLWRGRGSLPPGEGVGLAGGVWGGAKMSAGAVARLEADGNLTLVTGAVDMTGSHTSFAAVAAEAFGVPFEKVSVAFGDTAVAPLSPPTGGSVSSYSVALAVKKAAEEAREKLLQAAALQMEIDPADLEIVDGVVRPVGSPERGIPIAEMAPRLTGFAATNPPIEGLGGAAPSKLAPSTAVHLVHVRVDEETGDVEVLASVIAQDCGRALNPALVEGQMRGAVAQGLGWALSEELFHDAEGVLLNGSFLDYAVPRAGNVPAVETVIVEVPAPEGPFGAKGIGEASVVGAPAAVANAIAAATGLRLRELPMTSERIWDALANR